jgi:hypothetical protein
MRIDYPESPSLLLAYLSLSFRNLVIGRLSDSKRILVVSHKPSSL